MKRKLKALCIERRGTYSKSNDPNGCAQRAMNFRDGNRHVGEAHVNLPHPISSQLPRLHPHRFALSSSCYLFSKRCNERSVWKRKEVDDSASFFDYLSCHKGRFLFDPIRSKVTFCCKITKPDNSNFDLRGKLVRHVQSYSTHHCYLINYQKDNEMYEI